MPPEERLSDSVVRNGAVEFRAEMRSPILSSSRSVRRRSVGFMEDTPQEDPRGRHSLDRADTASHGPDSETENEMRFSIREKTGARLANSGKRGAVLLTIFWVFSRKTKYSPGERPVNWST